MDNNKTNHIINNEKNHVTQCHGVTKDPDENDYLLVFRHAKNGDLHKNNISNANSGNFGNIRLTPDVNWLTQFSWLEFRNINDQILMFCAVCSRIGKDNNIFIKGTNQYRKDYLVRHNNQPKHISNLDLIKNQRKIPTLFSKIQTKKIQNNNNNNNPPTTPTAFNSSISNSPPPLSNSSPPPLSDSSPPPLLSDSSPPPLSDSSLTFDSPCNPSPANSLVLFTSPSPFISPNSLISSSSFNPIYKVFYDEKTITIKLSIPGNQELKLYVYSNFTTKIMVLGNFVDLEFENKNFRLNIDLESYVDSEEPAEVKFNNGVAIITLKKSDKNQMKEIIILQNK